MRVWNLILDEPGAKRSDDVPNAFDHRIVADDGVWPWFASLDLSRPYRRYVVARIRTTPTPVVTVLPAQHYPCVFLGRPVVASYRHSNDSPFFDLLGWAYPDFGR